MASRAIIGKVDRQGNGRAIFLGHGCYPDDAGAMLLENYSDEEPIDRLIGSGAITRRAHAGTFDYLLPALQPTLGALSPLCVPRRNGPVLRQLLESRS